MTHKGDFTPGKTIIVEFNTHQADGTPITLAGTPAVSVYKNSTTQSTAGVSLTVDYDSLTGLQHVAIDTSADGTFYAAGNDFLVVITAGTVDSISVVGTVVGSFSLSNRSALRPTTADRTLDVTATGEAGLDWANIGGPTTSVNLSGTTISTSQAVASVSGAVGSVTGNVGGNVTGSVGSISGVTFPTNFAALSIGGTGHITNVDTLTTYTGNTPQTGDTYALANGASGFVAIAAKTANLPSDPADASDIAALFTTLTSHGDSSWATATGFAVAGNAMTLTSGERNAVADAVLTRDVSNVEGSANDHSLCFVVLAMSESSISGTTLTVKKTTGSTFATKTVTTDAAADPITGIS